MIIFLKKDIVEIKADIIVNASNGIGFMGGIICKNFKFKGVAESIQYKTKGCIEKEAKKNCKKNKYLPRYFCGHKSGEIFITNAEKLNASYIIHAVTMRYPGMKTNIKTIKTLLPKILDKAYELNAKSLVIPLLGTGTGGIKKDIIIKLYKDCFKNINDMEIIIVYI